MFAYYLLLIISSALGAVNNVWFMKKYQLAAGTGLFANVLLMIVNGILSALVAIPVLLVSREAFQATPYSLSVALATVLCAAVSTLALLKAYETGQIAIANVFSVMGSILLSCAWGVLFLKETLSLRQTASIALIVAAILLFTLKPEKKTGRPPAADNGEPPAKSRAHRLLMLYFLIFFSAGFVNILSKVHQVEKTYATVNTLSFSIWIGLIRALLFSLFLPFLKRKRMPTEKMPKAAYGYASAVSIVGGGCYIVTLAIAAVLPLTITAPLSMGINMGLTSFLPWLLYREKLDRQEIAGILLSIMGILLYT